MKGHPSAQKKLDAAEKVARVLNEEDWEKVKTYLSILLLHARDPTQYANPELPPHLHPFGIVFSPMGGSHETDNLTMVFKCLD